jgi:hypothetical protein
MSLEKFGFMNSKESVPPKKKKPKLTKRQETKFMMTEKEPEHLYQHNTYLYVIDFNKSSIY